MQKEEKKMIGYENLYEDKTDDNEKINENKEEN